MPNRTDDLDRVAASTYHARTDSTVGRNLSQSECLPPTTRPTANVDRAERSGTIANRQSKPSRPLNRLHSSQIPARLRFGTDVHDDVTAPSRAGPTAPQYMNQSIFSMIAAAGSHTGFNKRFDESSDSENDAIVEEEDQTSGSKTRTSTDDPTKSPGIRQFSGSSNDTTESETKRKQYRQLASQSVMYMPSRSSLKKTRRSASDSGAGDRTSTADGATSPLSPKDHPRDAPLMTRMLSAQAALQEEEDEDQEEGQTSEKDDQDQDLASALSEIDRETRRGRSDSSPATLLATRLMEIFGFEQPETVIAEYPCWLLQSVLLQGYLYITKRHICFYAYLKKSSAISKTGYLSKRGKNNPQYKRYWFSLKGDVFSYYSNPSDLYFPQGNIDLRYGITASISTEKGNDQDCKDFCVVTDHRVYHFRADSPVSAREWVKTLQKTIFRSHNDGDSVKISLPVEDVVDIEESPVVEFAETVKVRVIESGDSYAIDEYFFSFFSFGRDALNALASLVEGAASTARQSVDAIHATNDHVDLRTPRATSPTKRQSQDMLAAGSRDTLSIATTKIGSASPAVNDGGKFSPFLGEEPRKSGRDVAKTSGQGKQDEHRGPSFDLGRQIGGASRLDTRNKERILKPSRDQPADNESNASSDAETSTAPASPSVEAAMSASQILNKSDVFHKPRIQRMETLHSISTGRHTTDALVTTSPQPDHASQERPGFGRHFSSDRRAAIQAEAADSDTSDHKIVRNTSAPALQDLVRAGSYPLARAGAFAGYIKNRSSKMSKLLATESMSYLEKVSGMWAGGHRHYGENEGVVNDDQGVDPEDELANTGYGDRFRAHFALPPSEKLQATYFGWLHRVLPLYGKIYISNKKFCFRSFVPGTRTKVVLPLKDIENVDKEKGFQFGYHGLVIVIRGHEELFFEFSSADHRDDCTVTLLHGLESVRYMAESGLLAKEDEDDAEAAQTEHRMLQEARKDSLVGAEAQEPPSSQSIYLQSDSQVLFDDPRASIINFKPKTPLRITCLTIGSRGDVQPYIALCKGLLAEGHKPRIATHAEFGPWIQKHGIDFVSVGGDPAELMRICVENGMFTYSFLREATAKFRTWIDELLHSAWKACQGSDVLIESPSAMAGIHIAEALGIPYFRAFTMPWTRTRAYPHAFAVPEHKIGGAYNYFSYVMFDAVFWKGISAQVNRWRQRELGLSSTNLDKMQPNQVPFLYNFSPNVVPPPLDYSDWVRVTGYWFLDETKGWVPPNDLQAFIKKARKDNKKLVYIGFGSIVVSDPAALTRTVVESVLKADVRCILSKGWSDRLGDPSRTKTEVALPPEILQIKAAPHDWLFFQVDAAVHHGGAGTTGASLRAGIPTVIKPFFGDQFFFGGRVEDLGVGILLRRINVSVLARALWESVHSERMIVKARWLGEKIRAEDGVTTAIQAIYRDLEYAQTLVKARQALSKPGATADDSGQDLNDMYETEADLEGEESWTFIGGDTDPELRRRIEEFETNKLGGKLPRRGLGMDQESITPGRSSSPITDGAKRMSMETKTNQSPAMEPGRKSFDLKRMMSPKIG